MIKFDETNVSADLKNNPGAREVFEFLMLPETVNKKIIFSDMQLPALTGIVKDLESKYTDNQYFPLSNNQNRKRVGKMMKFIMNFYGYKPTSQNNSKQTLRKFSQAKLFKTSAVYEKIDSKPKLELTITSKRPS